MLKKLFKGGLVTVAVASLVGVGVALIAGEGRSRAMIHQVQERIQTSIDKAIDDPTAIRAQLQELEQAYPERIAQVRGDLAELNEEIRQLERQKAIAEKVVSLAERDLAVLEPKLSRAADERADAGGVQLAAVSFRDRVYSYDRAHGKLSQIRQTRVSYSDQAAAYEHDLLYLRQQSGRLEETLVQLESEHATFQGQLQHLSRQVDAIARNGRLIDMLEKRNKTLEEVSRYEGVSLDHLTGKLASIRTRQEAELDVLSSARRQVDYEDMARMELDAEQDEQSPQDYSTSTAFDLPPAAGN